MNVAALILMIIAMVLIWGGLLASIIHLMKNPDIPIDEVRTESV